MEENEKVKVENRRKKEMKEIERNEDIMVEEVGSKKMVKGDWVKKGEKVIDVGIKRIKEKERGEGKKRIVGDVDFEEDEKVEGEIKKVKGGVGKMKIEMMMENKIKDEWRSEGMKKKVLWWGREEIY